MLTGFIAFIFLISTEVLAKTLSVLPSSRYQFDRTISRNALESYLDRSVTMAYFLVTGKPEGYKYLYKEDDIRVIKNISAKFVGRAIYRCGEESRLNDPDFWTYAKNMVNSIHTFDPEIIFQGCLFEYVSCDVDKVKIPAWVFTAFNLPVENRSFCCDSMINSKNRMTRFGNGGVFR